MMCMRHSVDVVVVVVVVVSCRLLLLLLVMVVGLPIVCTPGMFINFVCFSPLRSMYSIRL